MRGSEAQRGTRVAKLCVDGRNGKTVIALVILATGLSLSPRAVRAGQLPASAFQAYSAANAASIVPGPFSLYTVSVGSLVPTQFNVGLAEVGKKADGFNILTSQAALSANLLTDIEPVVIGPGGVLYQTDGHHTFRALLSSAWGSTNPTVDVNVIANYSNLTPAQFWALMQQNNLLLPLNGGAVTSINLANGSPLPTSLLGMTNDPYRGLEYSILKNKSSKLFTTTSNITGAIGSAIPGLDKTAAFYSDFIWAGAYRGANNGLGLPYLSPADTALATKWNLNGANATTLPNAAGGTTAYTVAQLPGYILPSSIAITGAISDATLANGTLDGSTTGTFNQTSTFASFNGLRGLNLGTVTIGANAPGFVMQLGNDSGGTVSLSGANTYTGGTTILAGTLIVNGDSALGAAPTGSTISTTSITKGVQAANGIVFNSLTEGNGTLRITNSFATSRAIAVSGEVANLDVNGNTLTLNGQIYSVGALSTGIGNATGISDITLNDSGTNGKLVVAPTTGSNSNFFGNWILTKGTLQVASDAALGNTSGPSYEIGQIVLNGGTFQPTAAITSNRGFKVQSKGSVFDTNGLTSSWGAFVDTQRPVTIGNNNAGTSGAATFSSLEIGGAVELTVNGGSGATATAMTLTNGIIRDPGGTLFLNPTSGSFGTREKILSTTAPTLTNGIAPVWTLIDSAAANNPYDFATYGANGYTAFAGYSTDITAANATSVVKQGASATLAASVSAGALNIQKGFNITATGRTLTLGDGTNPAGLILNGGSGSGITGGTLAFGGSEAVIAINGSSTISSVLTGTGGLTLTGTGTLTLSTAMTNTGPVTIDSGSLAISAVDALKTSTAGVTLADTKNLLASTVPTLAVTANNTVTAINDAGGNGEVDISNNAKLTIGDSTNLDSVLAATVKETGTGQVGAITKNGTGLLDLSGSGGVTIASGGTIAVNAGAVRIGNGVMKNANAISVASGAELQYSGNGGAQLSNPITGAGIFHLLAGTVQLNGTAGSNTYTGGTVIEQGTILDVTTGTISTGNANITSAGGTVVFDQNTNGTYSGVISDGQQSGGLSNLRSMAALASGPTLSGNLIKDDSSSTAVNATNSNVTLSAVQTYTGYTVVEAGTLTLGATNAIATSSLVDLGRIGGAQTTGGSAQTATLALGADNTIKGLMSETGNTTAIALNGHALTVSPTTAATTTFSGNIGDTGAGSLVKAGIGTLILNGANTVGGTTTISGGTLAVGDEATPGATLTSTGGVTVGAAGTLMGHGTITGAITNSAGGVVSPGGSIGTMSVSGTYSQASNSSLAIAISPTTSSQLAVSGTGGTASLAGTLAIVPQAGTYVRGTSFQVVTATGGVTGTFDKVTGSVPQLLFATTYKANEVDVMLTGFQAANNFSGNQAGDFNALSKAPIGSATDALLNTIGSMSGTAQQQALDQLNPYAGLSNQASFTVGMQAFQETMGGRASADPGPASAVQTAQLVSGGGMSVPFGSYTVWAQGFGQFSTIDATNAAPSQSTNVAGGAFGMEAPIDPHTRIGGSVAYSNSSTSVANLAQTGNAGSYALGF